MASDPTRTDRQHPTLKDETVGGGDTSQRDLDRTAAGDSTGFDLAPTNEQLRQIGKFECRGLIGKGGMGAVYLAFDPLIEREVAIKVLPEGLSENDPAITRFLVEARAIGQMNHPNVISIHDIGEQDGRFFIVTELARGGNVGSLVKAQGSMPIANACRITLDAARGLQAAHIAGIVHRDVKPENLMLSAGGVVKLVDFGLAKAIDRSQQLAITMTGQILGTPMYMAPEQIEDGVVDARTDIYSLGATFYHLLTGQPPFKRESITKVLFAHVGGARPDPREFDANIPKECSNVIARAMAIDPANRYQSMAELIQDVESLLEQESDDSISAMETQLVSLGQDLPHVLLIEPSKFLAKMTCEIFSDAGCKITHVSTPEEAVAQVRDHPVEIAIASRQLAGAMGEELLRAVRALAGTSQVTCVITSSESPDELMVQSFMEAPAAYVRKQASPVEMLRAIFVSSRHSFSELPFSRRSNVDLEVGILSQDGSVPEQLGGWLSDLGVSNVAGNSLRDLSYERMQSHDLVIWLDRSSETESEFAARLIGATAQKMARNDATVAIVDTSGDSMQLRGVKRFAFQSTCDREFNCEAVERLLSIATKLDSQSSADPRN